MAVKLEVTIDVIVHATEDVSKFFKAFQEMFGLIDEDFSINQTRGHFDNPITILNAKLVKKQASGFVEKLTKLLSKEQIDKMTEEIKERTVDSRYHVRIDKQELIKGKILLKEKDAVKLKIHTPIYNKKDTVQVFSRIFSCQLG